MLRKVSQYIQSSIQRKLYLSYALIILIPLCIIGIFLYVSASGITQAQTEENRTLLMKSLSQNIDQYVQELELLSQSVYLQSVQEQLNQYSDNIFEKVRMDTIIFDEINQWYGLMNLKVKVDNMIIVRPNGDFFAKNPVDKSYDFLETSWYKKAIEQKGRIILFGPNLPPYQNEFVRNDYYTFSLAREINNTMGNEKLGVILIDVRIDDLSQIFSAFSDEISNDFFILNANNEIIYNTNRENIGQKLNIELNNSKGWTEFQGNQVFYIVINSEKTNWRFVTLDALENIKQYSWDLRNLTIIVGFLTLVIAMLISIFVSKKITNPLLSLKNQLKRIETGDFNHIVPVISRDEIGQLTRSFNHMTEQMNILINKVYKAEINEKEAQLKALHSQINPHFLYNTLDSMSALATIEDVPEIAHMAQLLADIFRYSITDGEEEVPLYKELEHVKRYVTIQQLRYDDKFDLQLTVAEKYLTYPILKLSIQPIVENAIYHGLELLPHKGRICITVEENHEYLFLKVQDNGMGMDEETIQQILRKLEGVPGSAQLGIQNVHERIKLRYGNKYGLALESKKNQGTTVIFKLPRSFHLPGNKS